MSLLLPIASNMAKILNDIDTSHATHYEARMTFQKSRLFHTHQDRVDRGGLAWIRGDRNPYV